MSVTIEQQRQRVEAEMTKIIDDLDRSVLRKMQASKREKKCTYIFEWLELWWNVSCVSLCDVTRDWTITSDNKFESMLDLTTFSSVFLGWYALVCSQMLWWQNRQHRFSSFVYWTVLGASESCPAICTERNGRLPGTFTTMRYGMFNVLHIGCCHSDFHKSQFFFIYSNVTTMWN